jgi:3-oxoadipate enol-lactonase
MPTLTINGCPIAYDETGSGEPLLLIHAGIADRRMWDDVLRAFSEQFRTIRLDLQGYGDTPLPDGPFAYGADVAGLLTALDLDRANVLGISMGGGVAMDVALSRPELVDRLVLVAPGLPGWPWGDAMNAFDEAETAALERGDLDAASWINVRFWLDGPRPPDEVDAELRQRVFEMQRQAFEMDNPNAEGRWLVPDRGERLGEIVAPTLVVVGDLDQPDFATMARRIADGVQDGRLLMMAGVAHLPPMEAPDEFARLVTGFLRE